jgi:hypothetical protein
MLALCFSGLFTGGSNGGIYDLGVFLRFFYYLAFLERAFAASAYSFALFLAGGILYGRPFAKLVSAIALIDRTRGKDKSAK